MKARGRGAAETSPSNFPRRFMPSPRILILHNEPVLPPGHPDAVSERDILEAVEIVDGILVAAGFRVSHLGVGRDLDDLLHGLRKRRPAAVFNLFEGLADCPFTETVVAGVLDWLDVPFTGAPAEALALARDKSRSKTLMQGAGLPTAPFFTVDQLPCPKCPLTWPVFVKPADQDASVGINQDSVVTNQRDLARRVAYVLEHYGPALVEQFIPGREFHISIAEGAADKRGQRLAYVLPLAEIVFKDPALWPIYSYDAKWAKASHEYAATPQESPIIVPEPLAERLADIARRAHRLLSCRDYSRVDVRVTAEGDPFILEVNPNPFINSMAWTHGLEAIGYSHDQFVVDLALAALSRRKRRPSVQCPRIEAAVKGRAVFDSRESS
jgi:D-alanine-D-alanine ligase